MTRSIYVLLLLLGGLFTSQVKAQQKRYSLQDILQRTLQYYPSLASKKNDLEAQQLRKNLVRMQQLPDLNVQAQQTYGSLQSVAGSFFPLPGIYNTSGGAKTAAAAPGAVSNLYGSGVLQWNVLQFGRVRSRLQVADAATRQSSTALGEETLRVQVAVLRAYFTLQEETALLREAEADVHRLGELLNISQVQANAGLRPAADTLLIKSAYLQATGKVHQEQGLVATAQFQLAALMGEDPDSFTTQESPFHKIDGISELSPSDSLPHHPYLQYLKAGIEVVDATRKVIQKELYPYVSLLAGAGVRGSGIGEAGQASKSLSAPWQNATGTYLAGIGITWNFSSLYQNKTKQRIADRTLEAAKADFQEANLQLKAAFQAAQARSFEDRRKVWDAQKALTASREAYELYTVRYNTGLINLIELLELQKNLQDAERNYVEALGSYWSELINQSEAAGDVSFILSQIKD